MEKVDRMQRKRKTPEEITSKLHRVDMLAAQAKSIADAVRCIGTTQVTYYRWWKK
jgi:ACT domain-containing protein